MANQVAQLLAHAGVLPVYDTLGVDPDPAVRRIEPYLDVFRLPASDPGFALLSLPELLEDSNESTGILMLEPGEFDELMGDERDDRVPDDPPATWFVEALRFPDRVLVYPQDLSIGDHLASFFFVSRSATEIELLRPPPIPFASPQLRLRHRGARKTECGYKISWDDTGTRVLDCKSRGCHPGCAGRWVDLGDDYYRLACDCPGT